MVEIPLNTYCVCVSCSIVSDSCDPPGCCVHEVLYARILAIPSPGDLPEWLKLNTNNNNKILTTTNTEKNMEEQVL